LVCAVSFESLLLGSIHELTLYAAVGFALFGLDDLLVDGLWIAQLLVRRPLAHEPNNPAQEAPQSCAIFIPTWHEEDVIGSTLDRIERLWSGQDYMLFVGCYPNDPATQLEVGKRLSCRVRLHVLDHDGPTTKADCLNGLWRALAEYEASQTKAFGVIILHDAEDWVDLNELRVFAQHCDTYDFVQIPVVPIPDRHSKWISGHYLDEFAEAHLKEMVVRERIGASVPSAGTGSSIRKDALATIASGRGGVPFDADSLTEDYELGLRLCQTGHRSAFVRARTCPQMPIVAVRSSFPGTLSDSVRQKTRWILGIALAGWDRTGWRGGIAEHWMRWRDRRVLIAATLIVAAYLSAVLNAVAAICGFRLTPSPGLATLLACCFCLFLWRLGVRMLCTWTQYGWREGLRAAPRILISNLVAVMASWRAIRGYVILLRNGHIPWDKTEHKRVVEPVQL
jgi:bacteriophage N4 adsorption protein B